jgi:hypothetical protein
LPPLADVTAASARAAADAKAVLIAFEADSAFTPQASEALFAQALAKAVAVADACAEPDAEVWHPMLPRTETVTEAMAFATAWETASAEVDDCALHGQVLHCAKASEEALETAFCASPDATAVLEAEQLEFLSSRAA